MKHAQQCDERTLLAERKYREQQEENRKLMLEIERTRCPKLAELAAQLETKT